MGDDTQMRDRVRPPDGKPKSSVFSMLEAMPDEAEAAKPATTAKAVPPPADAADPIPGPDDDYRAFARPVRQEIGLAFLTAAVPFDSFGYFDLRRVRLLHPDKPGEGPVLVLRFIEGEMTEVVIEGRNLTALADYLRQHRIAWIRELPKGMRVADAAATVVTQISYHDPVVRSRG